MSSSSDDCELKKVNGDHLNGKLNSDVLYLHSHKKLSCFPKNVKDFFKNLTKLYFAQENFPFLTKADLQSLGIQLKKFWFEEGQIEVIPADLFEHSTNLESIFLSFNKIQHVEEGTFSNLQNLNQLHLYRNPCHYEDADDRDAVLSLIEEIESECTDEEVFLKFKNQQNTIDIKLSDCNDQIKNLTDDLRAEKEKNHKLAEEVQLKNIKIIKLEDQNRDLLLEAEFRKKELLELVKNASKSCNEAEQGIKEENFTKLSENIMEKLKELQLTVESKFNTSDANQLTTVVKLKAIESKLDLNTDTLDNKFTSINATCYGLDHKIGVLTDKCLTRQP